MRRFSAVLLLMSTSSLVLTIAGHWDGRLFLIGVLALTGSVLGQYVLWRRLELQRLQEIMSAYADRHL